MGGSNFWGTKKEVDVSASFVSNFHFLSRLIIVLSLYFSALFDIGIVLIFLFPRELHLLNIDTLNTWNDFCS